VRPDEISCEHAVIKSSADVALLDSQVCAAAGTTPAIRRPRPAAIPRQFKSASFMMQKFSIQSDAGTFTMPPISAFRKDLNRDKVSSEVPTLPPHG
jgi:hypothetical protein